MDLNNHNLKQSSNQEADNYDDQVRVSADEDQDLDNISLEQNSVQKVGQ